jgi:hypothetical protein
MSTAGDLGVNEAVARWRLMLGESAQAGLGSPSLDADSIAVDAALSWLYNREGDLAERDVRPGARAGGSEQSRLTVPHWINEVHRLFPKETIERLERDAVERYQIHEVVTNPEVLRRVEPNMTLLQAVLRTKHLMNPEVLGLGRELVARVVRELMEKLAREVQASFGGTRDRRRWSALKSAANFDPKRTIRHNLRHYSVEERRLYIQKPFFLARTRRHSAKWQLIILVDESGSMMGSVIHAAVTAACLWGLPALKTHLCIFDTQVVDLTDRITDPVEVLMKVQLGGGTGPEVLVKKVRALCEQGTQVLGLAALDETANPVYDRELARRLVDVGAHVGAMTPGQLAAWIAEKVRT